MLLGALLHAGADQLSLEQSLHELDLEGLVFQVSPRSVSSIEAFSVKIDSTAKLRFKNLPAILSILSDSRLGQDITEPATKVFTTLAEAEAKVHGIAVEKVHFHEVGAIDTIVDVVGVILCLRLLGVDNIVCSPLPTGHGFVKCDHGLLPLPAPAVCEILKYTPTYGVGLKQELITPTGAALIKTLANDFGPLPPMKIKNTGYGAGSRTLENGQPNLLRCIIGESENVSEQQQVEVIETNLDDWNPEGFGYLMDLLFENGALDVTLSPLHMKKNRPGFALQVICAPAFSHHLKQTIFAETSAIGLRFRRDYRMTLIREKVVIPSPWGEIGAKKINGPRGVVIYPEYDECRKIASANKIPLKEVYHRVTNYNP